MSRNFGFYTKNLLVHTAPPFRISCIWFISVPLPLVCIVTGTCKTYQSTWVHTCTVDGVYSSGEFEVVCGFLRYGGILVGCVQTNVSVFVRHAQRSKRSVFSSRLDVSHDGANRNRLVGILIFKEALRKKYTQRFLNDRNMILDFYYNFIIHPD